MSTQNRKDDHLRICLQDDVQCAQISNGLDQYRLRHQCLPELDYRQVKLETAFLGKSLGAPLLISSMTGGTAQAQLVNQRLAEVAQAYGLAMGVGSGRVVVEQPELLPTFAVRSLAPDILLMANLGAVQLNYGCGYEHCSRLVESLEADALILHLNPLQECIQPEGNTDFRGILSKIAQLAHRLPVPVVAKEVGNGISGIMAKHLIEAGVAAIDVAGAGGTSWAKVESQRTRQTHQYLLGQSFADWGIPTAECVLQVRAQNHSIPLIASGGIRNGLEVAKAIALGADVVGLAWPFLRAAMDSQTALVELTELLLAELRTALFCTGNATPGQMQRSQCWQKL